MSLGILAAVLRYEVDVLLRSNTEAKRHRLSQTLLLFSAPYYSLLRTTGA